MDKCKKEHVIIMGDFNAIVGEEPQNSQVGKYGLGERNERGRRLREFAANYKLVICNTLF